MKKHKIIIILLAVAMSFFVGYETYCYYVSLFNVSISSNSSNVICDVVTSEPTSSEANKYGYDQIKVIVKNYDTNNNLTGESFNYTLAIENNSNSNGLFGYNNSFNSVLELSGSLSNSSNSEDTYLIQVKADSGLSETISYKINLTCKQNY